MTAVALVSASFPLYSSTTSHPYSLSFFIFKTYPPKGKIQCHS